MKVVYVAGPYSAANEFLVKRNIAAAEELALKIWQAGGAAICPHLNTAHWGGVLTPADFINGDLAIVKRCDAVLMVPGWEASKGACQEQLFALENGVFIFYTLEACVAWIHDNKDGGGK